MKPSSKVSLFHTLKIPKELVFRVLVKMPSLLYHFFGASDDNARGKVTEKQKLEVLVVVPIEYNASTANTQASNTLDTVLSKERELFLSVELIYK